MTKRITYPFRSYQTCIIIFPLLRIALDTSSRAQHPLKALQLLPCIVFLRLWSHQAYNPCHNLTQRQHNALLVSSSLPCHHARLQLHDPSVKATVTPLLCIIYKQSSQKQYSAVIIHNHSPPL